MAIVKNIILVSVFSNRKTIVLDFAFDLQLACKNGFLNGNERSNGIQSQQKFIISHKAIELNKRDAVVKPCNVCTAINGFYVADYIVAFFKFLDLCKAPYKADEIKVTM